MCCHAPTLKVVDASLSGRATKKIKVTIFSAVILLGCYLLSLQSAAAQSFATKVDYPVSAHSVWVAVGDFNLDGKPDLATANFVDSSVSVLINNGNGTYATKVDYTTGYAPLSVVVADFNLDGKPDLALAAFGSNAASVLLNQGGGTFAPKVNYGTGVGPDSIAVGDFNADGKPDLVASNQSDYTVSVLINNGNGTFASQVTYATGAQPQGVAVGDFNGDSKADMVSANLKGGGVSVFLNQGNGTFAAKVDYATDPAAFAVAVGDFNLDGKLDVVSANASINTISVLINQGGGTFAPQVDYATGAFAEAVAVGDFNLDGRPDVVTANKADDTASVLLNLGNGTFAAKVDFATGAAPRSVAVGDFNLDGRPDMAMANSTSNTASVLLNTTAITYVTFGATVNTLIGRGPNSVVAGDFNLDGKPDVATANHTGDNVSVAINAGNGTFITPIQTYSVGTKWPRSIAVGDFNGDGKPDLATANDLSNSVSVLTNGGDGTFNTPAALYSVDKVPISMAVGDFNGDGKPDIAVACHQGTLAGIVGNSVSILINAGNGTFNTPAAVYSIGSLPTGIAAGDFNGDGKLDLAIANSFDHTLSILFNTGTGTFVTPAPTYPAGTSSIKALAAGDFNLDGKLDLVTASDGGPIVFLNDGTGAFNTSTRYSGSGEHQGIAVSDLNMDGKPDIVVTNYRTSPIELANSVSVFFNNGNGTFAARRNFITNQGPYSVTIGDFNLDGRPDIISSNSTEDISELLNLIAPTAAQSSISGQILDSDGRPLAGVALHLTGARSALAVTDFYGFYSFTDLDSGSFYTVTPELANYSFNPQARSFSLTGSRTDATFIAAPIAQVSANPIDTDAYFVRQQYLDFLGREPDAVGLAYWTNQIAACANDAACIHRRRIDVSAAFFMSEEFEQTGSFVYRLYEAGLGRRISYSEFLADRAQVVDGTDLEARKAAFLNSFVERAEFTDRFKTATSAESFVDALLRVVKQVSGVDLSAKREALIALYNTGHSTNESRILVLKAVIDDAQFRDAAQNRSFVLMQYFGYLKRNPDEFGYQFWLNVLNRLPGNYRAMVCAFLTSAEYQQRFSSFISHFNSECGQ